MAPVPSGPERSASTLGTKAFLGVVWFFVTYVVRFVVTLLVEPQVNPIKHFPGGDGFAQDHADAGVPARRRLMSGLFGKDLGLAVAGTVLLF